MINSLTGSQAVIIEKYHKLEKDIQDVDKQARIEKKPIQEDAKSNNKTETNHIKSKYISDLLNEFINQNDVSFDMVKDRESEEMILIIKDNKTDAIIKQIPSELTLKIGRYMEEKFGTGQLTNERI